MYNFFLVGRRVALREISEVELGGFGLDRFEAELIGG